MEKNRLNEFNGFGDPKSGKTAQDLLVIAMNLSNRLDEMSLTQGEKMIVVAILENLTTLHQMSSFLDLKTLIEKEKDKEKPKE